MKKRVLIGIIVLAFIILTGIIYYFLIRDPNFVKCGIQNCHGPIVCGETTKYMACTAVFAPGDNCRSLASCEIIDGNCQVVEQEGYKECVNCISDCWTPSGQNINGSCYSWCSGFWS